VEWDFGWGKKRQKLEGLVGVSETPTHIAAVYTITRDKESIVKAYFVAEVLDLAARQQRLSQFVAENNLQGADCSYVLTSGNYTLSLVDTPLVAKEETVHAIRWLLKDSVNYPIEEAIIDCFDVPFLRAKDNAQMVYAVATQKDLVPRVQALIEPSGLNLKYMDIPELVLRNIIRRHPEESKGCAFVTLDMGSGKLVLCREGNLCITRSFDLKMSELGKNPSEDGVTLESLALEIQRSFDYINSVFRQSIPNVIVLAPSLIDRNIISESLKGALGSAVFSLKTAECLTFEKPMTDEEEARCLLAIGGSMRVEETA
jgi:MSHA biogenesis protein MshI